MNLKELKSYFESFVDDYVFDWSLSDPFYQKDCCSQVAFSVLKQTSTKEDNLEKIKKAYIETFVSRKDGEYIYNNYNDNTIVNFESESSCWSDGQYVQAKISEMFGG